MKRIVIILSVIFAFTQTLKAQTVDSTGIKDSVEITLSIQARDVEYISGFIWNNDFYENLVDSIKPAYRKLVNPTATTPVIIKGYTKDFIEVVKMLRNDVCAIKVDRAPSSQTHYIVNGEYFVAPYKRLFIRHRRHAQPAGANNK